MFAKEYLDRFSKDEEILKVFVYQGEIQVITSKGYYSETTEGWDTYNNERRYKTIKGIWR